MRSRALYSNLLVPLFWAILRRWHTSTRLTRGLTSLDIHSVTNECLSSGTHNAWYLWTRPLGLLNMYSGTSERVEQILNECRYLSLHATTICYTVGACCLCFMRHQSICTIDLHFRCSPFNVNGPLALVCRLYQIRPLGFELREGLLCIPDPGRRRRKQEIHLL